MAVSNKTKALISLLSDTNQFVSETAFQQLTGMGADVLSELEEALMESESLIQHDQITTIINLIESEKLIQEFTTLIKEDQIDLLRGWALITKLYHPGTSIEKLEKIVDRIAGDIWIELNDSYTSLERTSLINQIFFTTHNFRIVAENTKQKEYLLLDTILFTKNGDDFSLLLFYLIIADKLQFKLYPVNLGRKIMLAYKDEEISRIIYGANARQFLFYINTSHKGAIISSKELQFLQKIESKYQTPTEKEESRKSLLYHLIVRLKECYEVEKNEAMIELSEKLLFIFH